MVEEEAKVQVQEKGIKKSNKKDYKMGDQSDLDIAQLGNSVRTESKVSYSVLEGTTRLDLDDGQH